MSGWKALRSKSVNFLLLSVLAFSFARYVNVGIGRSYNLDRYFCISFCHVSLFIVGLSYLLSPVT